MASVSTAFFVLVLLAYMVEAAQQGPRPLELMKLQRGGIVLFRLAILGWLGALVLWIWR